MICKEKWGSVKWPVSKLMQKKREVSGSEKMDSQPMSAVVPGGAFWLEQWMAICFCWHFSIHPSCDNSTWIFLGNIHLHSVVAIIGWDCPSWVDTSPWPGLWKHLTGSGMSTNLTWADENHFWELLLTLLGQNIPCVAEFLCNWLSAWCCWGAVMPFC